MQETARTKRRLLFGLVAACLLVVSALVLARPLTLQYRLWLARTALGHRDVSAAIRWLDAAAQIAPRRGEIAFLRARAYRKLARPAELRAQLLRAAELKYPIEKLKREETLMLLQSGQLPPGHPAVGALMADPQGDAREIYEAAVQGYLESFHVAPAEMLLDGWEADYPNDSLPHYFRGLIYASRQSWTEAAEAFQESLQLGASRPDTRLRLADSLREDYRYREALWHYEQCCDGKETAEVLFGRGKCLEALGDAEAAREAYGAALGADPKHFAARLGLGQLEYSQGEYEAAAKQLQLAVEVNPADFYVHHSLAWALLILGEKESAREHFKSAVRLRLAMLQVGNLQRRIAKAPDNARLRYDIGAILMANDQQSDAASWLRSLLQLEPDHRQAHRALADYYAERGEAELAERHRRATQ